MLRPGGAEAFGTSVSPWKGITIQRASIQVPRPAPGAKGNMPSFAKNGDIPRTVAIGGSSGLIGGALSASLEAAGSRVLRLPREGIDPRTLDGVDAVVNLGGTGIADGRWTAER